MSYKNYAGCDRQWVRAVGLLSLAVAWLALQTGCVTPVGADHATPRQSLRQIQGAGLNDRKPDAQTLAALQRFNQVERFEKAPDDTLRLLHEKAVETGEPDLLIALAELNHLAAERLRRSVKPWEPRDARDYDLVSACYAYLYLFGDSAKSAPGWLNERSREACDLYNIGLGWALTGRRSTNSVALLAGGRRRLPFGQIEIEFTQPGFPWPLDEFDRFLLADHFVVRGLTVRNRQRGLGAPLIGVTKPQDEAQLSRAVPATAFLRFRGGLADLTQGRCHASLELYSGFGDTTIQVNGRTVPLETDTTAHAAYTLNQETLWRLGKQQFLSARERVQSGVYLMQPYQRGRLPVVFVHGTFSSPVWWAEMVNTLRADPDLSQRCQFWTFLYNSGNPIPFSAVKLREDLAAKIHELDPAENDQALQQMVVIGHSQGGLLAKLAVTDTGDKLWRAMNTNRLEDLAISTEQRALIQHFLFHERLPCVQRVVFIATPHRGSYLAGNFVRRLSARFVSLPRKLVEQTKAYLNLVEKVNLPAQLKGRLPTSLDGMSPKNPYLLALADLPPVPGVHAHSLIAVKGDGDCREGKDGLVKYSSAHVDYAESEFIVRGPHSCQGLPVTIEEVRRILHEHLKATASSPPHANRSTNFSRSDRGHIKGFPLASEPRSYASENFTRYENPERSPTEKSGYHGLPAMISLEDLLDGFCKLCFEPGNEMLFSTLKNQTKRKNP